MQQRKTKVKTAMRLAFEEAGLTDPFAHRGAGIKYVGRLWRVLGKRKRRHSSR